MLQSNSFIKRDQDADRLGKMWNYFWEDRNFLKAKYPELTAEQIDFITSWSWAVAPNAMIWAFKSKLKKIGIFLALNYFILVLAIIYLIWGDPIPSDLLFVAPSFLIVLIFRTYFPFKAKRISWEQGWLNFDEFKTQQDNLYRNFQRLHTIITIIIALLVGLIFIFSKYDSFLHDLSRYLNSFF